jgi:ureidoglycolate dehydrogenase (NAD+)
VTGAERIAGDLDALAREIKAQPRADGFDEVLMPGERGAREAKRRSRDGISIPMQTWRQIGEVAKRFGVVMPA